MAIWYANSITDPDVRNWLYGEMAEAMECFACGEPLYFPMVMWSGATASIYFHERCATSFVLRLARDCWELEGARGGGFIDEQGCYRSTRAS